MYTRCPGCSSTFRVTAAILQMAAGEVRCGSCGIVFNALDTLVDDWTGTDLMLPGGSVPPRPRETEAAPALQPPADAIAPEESGPIDTGFEFNVPEDEWQHFFLTPPETAQATPARIEPGFGNGFDELADEESGPAIATRVMPDLPPADQPGVEPPRAGTLDEETADTDVWAGFLREAGLEPTAGEGVTAEADPDPADDAPLFRFGEETSHAEAILVTARPAAPSPEQAGTDASTTVDADACIPAEDADVPPLEPEEPVALIRVPDEDDEDGMLAGSDRIVDSDSGSALEIEDDAQAGAEVAAVLAASPGPETVFDWGPPPAFSKRSTMTPRHTGRWLAASLVAALALAAQWVHQSRDELAANPAWGEVVRTAYQRLGLPLYPDWPLTAYEIRSVKALVENAPQGTLDIVAEIAVTGQQPVGAPMLRVVLRDRWSNAVASGVFDPGDYLAEAPPPDLTYAPGTLIPARISLKDPGTTAQGFELDVCMPNRHHGLQCKSVRDPFRR